MSHLQTKFEKAFWTFEIHKKLEATIQEATIQEATIQEA